MPAQIAVDREKIAELCRRHGIRKLSLFGSALRDDFRPESDVDLLVVWRPEARLGYHVFRIEEDLARIFDGRKIDLVPEKNLSWRLRDRVLASAQVLYDEGCGLPRPASPHRDARTPRPARLTPLLRAMRLGT